MKLEGIITYILVGAIILVIAIPSIFTVNKRHKDRLIQTTEAKIVETAKRCYEKDVCQNEKITIKNLYDLKLLEEIANPITKEYYNEESYVLIKGDNIEFVDIK